MTPKSHPVSNEIQLKSNFYKFMKKQQSNCRDRDFFCLRKTCLVMKLTLTIIFLSLFQVSASVYSQTQRLTMKLNNASVKEALNEIEEKSDVKFLYKDKSIEDKQVSIDVQETPLNEILDDIMKKTGNTYRVMENNLIIISPENVMQPDMGLKGKVTNESGEPVAGAAVIIKGTTKGTITDADGSFVLREVPRNSVLVFSFMGMRPREVLFSGQTVINVVMEEETIGIEEVVAVGYVSQKKSLLTGSIATMKVGEELRTLPTVSAGNILIGKLSGVNISTVNGVPGATPSISIRTGSSWNKQPVTYVIDGVIRDEEDFNNLSANEIETVTVLKDAAAAAVYGSRSAGGVLLVTTKRGQMGKPVFAYSFNTGFDTRTKNASRTSAIETGELYNRINPTSDPAGWAWSQEELDHYKTVNNGWGYDQLDEVWRNPYTQSHNLSVTGGSEKIRYFTGASYIRQEGFLKPSTYDKYNFRLNVTVDVTKNFQFFAGMALTNNLKGVMTWEGDEGLYRKLLVWQPDLPVYTDSGKYIDYGWVANVGATVNGEGGYNKYNFLKPQLVLNATYKIPFIEGLSATAAFSKNYEYNRQKVYQKKYEMYAMKRGGDHNHIIYTDDASILGTRLSSYLRREYLYSSILWVNDYQLNLQLNYDHTFAKLHHVQGALVYEKAESNGSDINAQRNNFPVYNTDQWWAASSAAADSYVGGGADITKGRVSYIGQFNYDYARKYLVNFSFRVDGSMNFSDDNRWGFFPAGSVGWVISEEPFFAGSKKIDHLKLRFSAGLTGNDNVGGWQWQESYKEGNPAYFGTSPSKAVGITYGSVVNPNLTWEKALTYNAGADISFLKHWSSSAEYWFKKSYDILGARTEAVPTTFSRTMPDENYGQVNAQGVDFSLEYHNKAGGLEYYAGLTASYGWNKVIKKDYAENAKPYSIPVGRPLEYLTGLEFDHILRTQQDLDALLSANPNYKFLGIAPEVGMPVYKDLSGPDGEPDGIIDTWDHTVLKKNNYPLIYGLNLGGKWKGFNIDMTFSGKVKQQKSFQDLSGAGGVEWNRMWDEWYDNSWTEDNPDAWLPRRYSAAVNKYQVNNTYLSSFWLRDASFIRLKYLNIGYTIPDRLYKKVVNRVKVYFTGTNLFVLSKFSYYDPEISQGFYYPVMRSFNFGIDVTF